MINVRANAPVIGIAAITDPRMRPPTCLELTITGGFRYACGCGWNGEGVAAYGEHLSAMWTRTWNPRRI